MKSRVDKYSENNVLSRSSKNKELYEDLYSNTNYTNMVVIDDSNEIDISKIKEIVDREKREKKIPREAKLSADIYEDIPKIEERPTKIYDINQVLKEAKDKRDIIEEANERRKREHFNLKTNEELEEELAKTRKVYQDLIKEEKELLSIMNTLTNVSSTDVALDLFEDLKPTDNTIVTKPVNSDAIPISIKEVTNDNVNDDSKEYSTDTFMFKTKDFEGIENIKKQMKNTNIFVKILIIILTITIIVVGVFVIKKYLIK